MNMSSNHQYIIRSPLPEYIFETKGLGHELYHSMKKYSEEIAQIDGVTGATQTYKSMLQRCIQTATALRNIGIQPRDTISICSHNHMDTCIPLVASTFVGSVTAALDIALPKNDMRALLINFDPKVIFVSCEAEILLESILEELGLKPIIIVFGDSTKNIAFEKFLMEPKADFQVFETDDPSETILISSTGGTTGLHKGVCLNHSCIIVNCVKYPVPLRKSGVFLSYSPLIWWSGPYSVLSSIFHGCSKIVMPQFSYAIMWEMVQRFKVNYVLVGSGQVVAIMKSGIPKDIDASSLEAFVFGGGYVSKDILHDIRAMLPNLVIAYGFGNTEAGGAITLLVWKEDRQEDKLDSVGHLNRGISAKIVDINSGEAVGPNQPGEFRVKSKYCCNGYKNLSSSDLWDHDGYLKTGDICYYDEDGFIYYVDRLKEMIRYKTWAVSPGYFETILLEHPAVDVAFVTGVPMYDEDGDHAVGVIVLKENYHTTAKELENFVAQRQTDGRCLKAGIIIVDKSIIPYAVSGKIKRYELRRKILSTYFNK